MPNDSLAGYLGIQVQRTDDKTAALRIPVDGRLTDDCGAVHPVALLVLIDMAAGLCVGFQSLPRWTLTIDMAIELCPGPVTGDLHAVGTPTHVGGRMGLAEVRVTDDTGRTVALASANHALVPAPEQMPLTDLQPGDTAEARRPDWAGENARDLYAAVAVADTNLPSAELRLTAATTNPWGLFHGAVLSHLAVEAAGRAGVHRPESLTIRFMRPTRVGPAQATVTSTTDTGNDSICVVRITDSHDGTTTCLAYVRGPRADRASR